MYLTDISRQSVCGFLRSKSGLQKLSDQSLKYTNSLTRKIIVSVSCPSLIKRNTVMIISEAISRYKNSCQRRVSRNEGGAAGRLWCRECLDLRTRQKQTYWHCFLASRRLKHQRFIQEHTRKWRWTPSPAPASSWRILVLVIQTKCREWSSLTGGNTRVRPQDTVSPVVVHSGAGRGGSRPGTLGRARGVARRKQTIVS